MTAQHGRQIWDERKLKRLAAARADGLTMAQLAARFNCSRVTVERKLAELRNHACKNNFETTATSMAIAKLTTHVKS